MATTDLVPQEQAKLLENVLVKGDLKDLSPTERLAYYRQVCESLKLNPLTQPFQYITLNNRLVLYAKRDATDQLRALHHISVTITAREVVEGVYVVTARATTAMTRLGDVERSDESIGAVPVANLKGEALANAYMKAETKAKRRVTLSIVGLGWLDETETDTIVGAVFPNVDIETGEIQRTPLPSPGGPQAAPAPSEQGAGAAEEELFPPEAEEPEKRPQDEVVRNLGDLWTAAQGHYGLTKTQALRLTGYSRQEDIPDVADAWAQIINSQEEQS